MPKHQKKTIAATAAEGGKQQQHVSELTMDVTKDLATALMSRNCVVKLRSSHTRRISWMKAPVLNPNQVGNGNGFINHHQSLVGKYEVLRESASLPWFPDDPLCLRGEHQC